MAAYRYPVAVCSRCGRERPCAHARTDAPLCTTCENAGWQAAGGDLRRVRA